MGACWGACCGGKDKPQRLVNRYAYKTELGASFFDSIPHCPPDALVVVVHFKGLTDIIDSNDITPFSGPYLQLKLFPPDPIASEQVQRSSFKPETVNPLWVGVKLLAGISSVNCIWYVHQVPEERFQIVSTAKEKSKILLSM
jgi:hypothetical protein